MTLKQFELIKLLLGLPYVTPGRLARAFRRAGVDILLKEVQIAALSFNYEAYQHFDPLVQFDPDQREMLERLFGKATR